MFCGELCVCVFSVCDRRVCAARFSKITRCFARLLRHEKSFLPPNKLLFTRLLEQKFTHRTAIQLHSIAAAQRSDQKPLFKLVTCNCDQPDRQDDSVLHLNESVNGSERLSMDLFTPSGSSSIDRFTIRRDACEQWSPFSSHRTYLLIKFERQLITLAGINWSS